MIPVHLAQVVTGGQIVRGTWPEGPVCVVADSRRAVPGCVFVACADDAASRESHAAQAVAAGAVAVVAEVLVAHGDTLILVPHAREVYARCSAVAHGLDCGRHPPLFAVTGTDGKTTTSWCAWHALGPGAARIGTLGFHDGHRVIAGANTTPGPDELHPFLAGLDPTTAGVALELSSIGLDQRRLAGLRLHGLAHTGLGHDHLDYHGDRDHYAAAKLLALELVVDDGLVVLDADDVALAEAAALAWARGLDLITLDRKSVV
jgi:UDP-N-acetylmuramoyl-L-alanyl-D-glutamate--2,6-diaminopimelate ligase